MEDELHLWNDFKNSTIEYPVIDSTTACQIGLANETVNNYFYSNYERLDIGCIYKDNRTVWVLGVNVDDSMWAYVDAITGEFMGYEFIDFDYFSYP